MQHHTYQSLLETSRRVNWNVDDVIGGDRRLDFCKPFLPESFVRAESLEFLSSEERLLLNHIRANGYLSMFRLVEEFILPFIESEAAGSDGSEAFRQPALSQFALEEAKHIELFRRFGEEFRAGFPVECPFIGPADKIGAAILGYGKLPVAIAVLGIEWMSQRHYIESIRDAADIDPQFKSLLRNHWIEEAQHAKLDALVLAEIVAQSSLSDIEAGFEGYLQIGAFFDAGLRQQVDLDLAAFEEAAGRPLSASERETFISVQHQAQRWTYLGSAMTTPGFLEVIGAASPEGRARIEAVAPAFC